MSHREELPWGSAEPAPLLFCLLGLAVLLVVALIVG